MICIRELHRHLSRLVDLTRVDLAQLCMLDVGVWGGISGCGVRWGLQTPFRSDICSCRPGSIVLQCMLWAVNEKRLWCCYQAFRCGVGVLLSFICW